MGHHLDSVDYVLEAEAMAHAAKTRDAELRICLGDAVAGDIEAKLRESEAYVDARLDALAERIARLERER